MSKNSGLNQPAGMDDVGNVTKLGSHHEADAVRAGNINHFFGRRGVEGERLFDEDVYAMLNEMGINVVETEDADNDDGEQTGNQRDRRE